jgi:LacI family transcriptional regulator
MNLEEVARLAGVSRSTVSRVVNDDPRVSADARARVQDVIREHQYHPNAAARSLASSRTRILGMLIPQPVGTIFHDHFFAILIKSVIDACNAHGQNLMLLMESSDDPAVTERLYRRVIRGRHLDGIIIAASFTGDPMVAMLARQRFPVVHVGRHPETEICHVDVDNRDAARQAVRHLVGHGFTRIGYIGGTPNLIASIDRRAGYLDALTKAGLEIDPTLEAIGDFSEHTAYDAMLRLIDHPKGPPEAVFCASDPMALAAMTAARDRNLRVPADIAFFGFDGIDRDRVDLPTLSTVVQPIHELGQGAVELLLQQIDEPAATPGHRILTTELAIRQSCGCAARPATLNGGIAAM